MINQFRHVDVVEVVADLIGIENLVIKSHYNAAYGFEATVFVKKGLGHTWDTRLTADFNAVETE